MASATQKRSKPELPIPTGPYTVGCTDVMTGTGGDSIFFRLYYPTALTNIHDHSSLWPTWIPHPKYIEGYASVAGITPFIGKKLVSWILGSKLIPNVSNAVPSTEKAFIPVVFSHGLTSCRTTYSVFCSELASHGMVVAAVEHADSSACITYRLSEDSSPSKGPKTLLQKWIPYKAVEFEKNDQPFRQEQLLQRTSDCTKALDILTSLNQGDCVPNVIQSSLDLTTFKGVLDMTRPVLAGHSFGSATMLRTLAIDKRFQVGVALDAWMWPLKDESPQLASRIEQPILFINMEAFQNGRSLKVMKRFTDANSRAQVYTLRGSVHKNQADLPLLLPPYLRRLTRANSLIDPHLAMTLNNRLALLFIWNQLGFPVHQVYASYVEDEKHWIIPGITLEEVSPVKSSSL